MNKIVNFITNVFSLYSIDEDLTGLLSLEIYEHLNTQPVKQKLVRFFKHGKNNVLVLSGGKNILCHSYQALFLQEKPEIRLQNSVKDYRITGTANDLENLERFFDHSQLEIINAPADIARQRTCSQSQKNLRSI